jgi:subtilisin family serine protease
LVRLTPLMERTSGRPEVIVGLIDGPVAANHPGLATGRIREIPATQSSRCLAVNSIACVHGTFVAGVLSARRGTAAPAICPECTLLVHRIFPESTSPGTSVPIASPSVLAAALIDCVLAGAWLINLSAVHGEFSSFGHRELDEALTYAANRGVIIVAAAGNQGMIAGSAITRHPWVIPVTAYDRQGRPMGESNLSRSIGRQGLGAPGDSIASLGAGGSTVTMGGTSVAAPFVTGAIALLWSLFPDATVTQVKQAMAQPHEPRRATVIPPLLDAWAAYEALVASRSRRGVWVV